MGTQSCADKVKRIYCGIVYKALTKDMDKIAKAVDDIWADYDKDKNGYLDRKETKKFVQDVCASLDEEFFDDLFEQLDKNNSGTIEKAEMASFVTKYMSGGKD